MAAVPPPYAPRESQVQPGPSTPAPTNTNLEFAETSSVTLEWRLTNVKHMYESTRGEHKSKCMKSAVFGDADNLWEVLWYANAGAQASDYASLYLSCVPTLQERNTCVDGKWSRKGLWWFRFEIKTATPDDRTQKPITLATKDASDHTFAFKTANWGWQQFMKRDTMFLNPSVVAADSFTIICTIQAQSQPPAGYWLGIGSPPKEPEGAVTAIRGRAVGSGGGLSAWAGGDGAAGGVAGGVAAAGGVKRVVPAELVDSIGAMLDDPLYSDIEFIIPPRTGSGRVGSRSRSTPARRIYANKKLLSRCEYFEAMFSSGFREEIDGDDDESDDESDEDDFLSDSDVDDEIPMLPRSAARATGTDAAATTTATAAASTERLSRSSTRDGHPLDAGERSEVRTSIGGASGDSADASAVSPSTGEDRRRRESGGGDSEDEGAAAESPPHREVQARPSSARASAGAAGANGAAADQPVPGPPKTKVIIRDAAWSTWWAVLYWLYTDIIYFAPLTSSFERGGSASSSSDAAPAGTPTSPGAPTEKSRRDWIRKWAAHHETEFDPPASASASASTRGNSNTKYGPRPVSAKSVYRLADKLDLPALKFRAFQHICGELTSDNIPAEVFGRFASTFEDVRKVEIAFFLKHWSTLKKSETMAQIWPQMRAGKHVGLEEVWPLILSQLEFKPA